VRAGGEAERAALHYAQAARRAATLNANVEARAALDRALRLESDDGRRFELFSLHGKMSARLADAAAEAAAQDELESLAARLDGDAACIALIRRIELEFGRGNPDAELAAIERLTQLATEAGGERWLAAAAEARARREQRNSRWDASVASALDARERYGRLGDEVASVRAAALGAQSCGFAPERAAEAERLAALRSYNILDTPPEPEYEAITALIAELCAVPIALVSLVDENRQWFKSNCGLSEVSGTSRDVSFCTHAIEHKGILEIPDTLLDPRFAQNPLVLGEPFLRFYAGAPLVDREGMVLGTLCVADRVPRRLTLEQWSNLARLAISITNLIVGRKR